MDMPAVDLESIFEEHQCGHPTTKWLDVKKMRRGVEARCPTCCLISACINWAVPALLAYTDISSIHSASPGTIYLHREHYIYLYILELFRLATQSGPIATARILPGATSSTSTFAAIEAWLMKCDAEHVRCAEQSARTAGKPPKGVRFLEIKRDTLLLVEHAQDQTSIAYACLSHCWGSGTHVVKTLTRNLHDHLTIGVHLDSLPLTFKDAVEACRRLRIDYLWIDSLCIIQDSDEDWRFQASLMADIYENARITIAASAAHDSEEGCFRKTHSSYVGQQLPGFPGVHIRRKTSYPSIDADTGWQLQKRGWVFQELCLSPRVIHFGPQEVVWQCRSTNESESRPNEIRYQDLDIIYYPRFSGTVAELQKEWHLIVMSYSWRALTVAKDRLPAIAGLATRMQQCRPTDRYLAGLWEASLCFDLMWCANKRPGGICDPATMIAQRIDDYSSSERNRMPSWSWASTTSGISWSYPSCEMLSNVEVLDIAYSILGPDVSGEIQNAAITLRAPLIRLEGIRFAYATKDCFNRNSELSHVTQESKALTADHLVYETVCWDIPGSGKGYLVLQDLFLLVLVVEKHQGLFSQSAIVLGQTKQPNTFCRVGVVDFQLMESWLDKLAWNGETGTYPTDRHVAYHKTLVSMLEATEPRVITLV